MARRRTKAAVMWNMIDGGKGEDWVYAGGVRMASFVEPFYSPHALAVREPLDRADCTFSPRQERAKSFYLHAWLCRYQMCTRWESSAQPLRNLC